MQSQASGAIAIASVGARSNGSFGAMDSETACAPLARPETRRFPYTSGLRHGQRQPSTTCWTLVFTSKSAKVWTSVKPPEILPTVNLARGLLDNPVRGRVARGPQTSQTKTSGT